MHCTEVGQAACIVALTVASHSCAELVYAVGNSDLQVKEPPHTDAVGAAVLEGALSRLSLPIVAGQALCEVFAGGAQQLKP